MSHVAKKNPDFGGFPTRSGYRAADLRFSVAYAKGSFSYDTAK